MSGRASTRILDTSVLFWIDASGRWGVEPEVAGQLSDLGLEVASGSSTREILGEDAHHEIQPLIDEVMERGVVREVSLRRQSGTMPFALAIALAPADGIRVLAWARAQPVDDHVAEGAFEQVLTRGAALADRLREHGRRQRGLVELSTSLAGALEPRDALERIEQALREWMIVERAEIHEVRHPPFQPRRWVVVGDPPESNPAEVAQVPSLSERVIHSSKEVLTSETPAADPVWEGWRRSGANVSIAALPLLGLGSTVGALIVVGQEEEPFSDEDFAWLEQFAGVVAAHLSLYQLREELVGLNAELERRVVDRTRDLGASEQRFSRVFTLAPQPMVRLDSEGNLLEANLNAQRLFGLDEAALRVRGLRGMFVEHEVDGLRGLVGDVASGAEGSDVLNRLVQGRRGADAFDCEIQVSALPMDGSMQVLLGASDVTERRQAEAALKGSLSEKETLLKEVHHRVKNNLQIVSSMLMLQSERMPSEESRALLRESVNRVRSMALIHQQLYGMDSLERVDFGVYTKRLTESLRAVLDPRARVLVEARAIELTVEAAVPLGLILNELLTNAFKYGLRDRSEDDRADSRKSPPWDVLVELSADEDALWISVTDQGPGLPDDFSLEGSSSVGLQLVRSLARQLRAEVKFSNVPGARFWVHYRRGAESAAADEKVPIEVQLVESGVVIAAAVLGSDRLSVGRSIDCTVVARERTVSARHATLWRVGQRVWLEDAGSRNGTFVNGQQLATAVPLAYEDRVRLGRFASLRLVYPRDREIERYGYLLEDLSTSERLDIDPGRHTLGGGDDDRIRVDGVASAVAALNLEPDGRALLTRGSEGPERIYFGQVFVVGNRSFRLLGIPPRGDEGLDTEPLSCSYQMILPFDARRLGHVSIVDLERGTIHRLDQPEAAAVLIVLGQKWVLDRRAGEPPPQRGWTRLEDLAHGVRRLISGPESGPMRHLIAEVRADLRSAGFDPWTVELRGEHARVRVEEVTLSEG